MQRVESKTVAPKKRIHILYVDDNETELKFGKLLIEHADPTIKVETTSSPKKALERTEHNPIECVVSDYSMPEVDGIKLALKIKEKRNIPVILYTGHGSEEIAEAAFASSINGYIRKRVDPEHYGDLVKEIRRVLSK